MLALAALAGAMSRSESRTHDFSGSPSWIGTAAPPVPTIALAIRLRMAQSFGTLSTG